MKQVVLVPGFWHGTWCWNLTTIGLAGRGIPSVAVDLQGQGLDGVPPESYWRRPFEEDAFASESSPVASITATTAARDLISKLGSIGGGELCVVVAHSMGGAVATLAAELEPSLFSHIVYVAALAPVDGVPAGAYMASPNSTGEQGTALLRADPRTVGASRMDTGDRGGHEAIRAALYGDVPVPIADAAITLLNVDAPVGTALEPVSATRENFGSVPRTYVVCERDRMIPPRMQEEYVEAMDRISATTTNVVRIDSSHSPFLSQPDVLAEVIAEAWKGAR
ncbi:alpha/beta hydrolase [Pseudonocardia kongjuensis]|uniref:Alpha/beta hydrolase n=1 Tax=Pseudonocardia kongjuensis TaxID=102227 RepID=A0ABP4IIM4_9PSEU